MRSRPTLRPAGMLGIQASIMLSRLPCLLALVLHFQLGGAVGPVTRKGTKLYRLDGSQFFIKGHSARGPWAAVAESLTAIANENVGVAYIAGPSRMVRKDAMFSFQDFTVTCI